MRIGLFSDVHANAEALRAVLKTLGDAGATKMLCAGDLVGYSTQPAEVIDIMRSRRIPCVRGNHEEALEKPERFSSLKPAKGEAFRATFETLTPRERAWLAALPECLAVEAGGMEILMVHGSPSDPVHEYVYSGQAVAAAADVDYDVLILGHTHQQFAVRAGRTLVVNPGACGIPRDGDPRAACAVLDTESGEVELLRVAYDAGPVIAANRRALECETANEHLATGQRAATPLDWAGDHRAALRQLLGSGTVWAPCSCAAWVETPQGVLVGSADREGDIRVRTSILDAEAPVASEVFRRWFPQSESFRRVSGVCANLYAKGSGGMRTGQTIFVSGVGGCGVGEGIAKAVLASRSNYRLIAGNMHRDAPMLYRAAKSYLLPPAAAPGYVDAVFSVIRAEGVDVFLPGSEAELRVVAAEAREFRRAGILLLASSEAVIRTGDDKWLTHQFLTRHGFRSPVSSLMPVAEEFWHRTTFPLVVKPRIGGHASQNVFVVGSEAEIEAVLGYMAVKGIEPILQEQVGTAREEYTVSVLLGRNGQLLGSIAMRRSLMGGFSQRVEIEDFPEIRRECEQIAQALGVTGPVNLQARCEDGRATVFEINPRFSGTTPFRAAVGFNEVEILVEHYRNGAASDPERVRAGIRHGTVGIRGLEEMILPRGEYEGVAGVESPAEACA